MPSSTDPCPILFRVRSEFVFLAPPLKPKFEVLFGIDTALFLAMPCEVGVMYVTELTRNDFGGG